MKKIITTIAFSMLLLAITSHSAWSQLSIKPQIGYQFSLAGGLLGTNSNNGSQTGVYGSWGQGLEFGLALDYTFTPCFTLELGGRYWDGSQVSISTADDGFSDDVNSNLGLFLLSLGDHYDFHCNGAFQPYLGFGVDMGVGGNVKATETATSPSGVTVGTSTTTANIPFGAYGELGAQYHLSSHFSIFGELRFDALSLVPNKMVVNTFTVNGINELSNLSEERTETDYEKSIPSSYTPTSTSPAQEIASPVPASTWGINIGIIYNLGAWSKSSGTK